MKWTRRFGQIAFDVQVCYNVAGIAIVYVKGDKVTDKTRAAKRTKWLRWIGRGLGFVVVAWWLLVAVGTAVTGKEPWTYESTIITVLLVALMASFAIAWWREGLGGALLTAFAVAFSIFGYFSAGYNRGLAMLISGGPFLISGVLLLVAWWRDH